MTNSGGSGRRTVDNREEDGSRWRQRLRKEAGASFPPSGPLAGVAVRRHPLARPRAQGGGRTIRPRREEVWERSRTLKHAMELWIQPLWLTGEDGQSWGRRLVMGSCCNGRLWESLGSHKEEWEML